jgi:hypothetical protein
MSALTSLAATGTLALTLHHKVDLSVGLDGEPRRRRAHPTWELDVEHLDQPRPVGALTEFLFPAPAQRNVGAILGWWEKRRIPYNIAVGLCGAASVGWIFTGEFIMTGGSVAAVAPWQGVVVFGLLANVCYTLGPAIEIIVHKIWGRELLPIGPALYRMGLTFSLGLALLPGMVMTISMIVRTFFAIFGNGIG